MGGAGPSVVDYASGLHGGDEGAASLMGALHNTSPCSLSSLLAAAYSNHLLDPNGLGASQTPRSLAAATAMASPGLYPLQPGQSAPNSRMGIGQLLEPLSLAALHAPRPDGGVGLGGDPAGADAEDLGAGCSTSASQLALQNLLMSAYLSSTGLNMSAATLALGLPPMDTNEVVAVLAGSGMPAAAAAAAAGLAVPGGGGQSRSRPLARRISSSFGHGGLMRCSDRCRCVRGWVGGLLYCSTTCSPHTAWGAFIEWGGRRRKGHARACVCVLGGGGGERGSMQGHV